MLPLKLHIFTSCLPEVGLIYLSIDNILTYVESIKPLLTDVAKPIFPPAINTTGGSCLNYLFISTFIIDETSTPSASIIATLLDSCIDFLSTL